MIDEYYDALDKVHSVDDCVALWKKHRNAIAKLDAQERAEAWSAVVALVAEMSGYDHERARDWLREATKV